MIASGDIIQIKQCLSVPYSAITQADVFSMAPSAACSESAFGSSMGSITPNAANQHLTISSTTASSNVSAKLLKLNSGDENDKNAASSVAKESAAKGKKQAMKRRTNRPNAIKKSKTSEKKHTTSSQLKTRGAPLSGLSTPTRLLIRNFILEMKPR